MTANHAVLELSDLTVDYPVRVGLLQRPVGYVKAVDRVNLTVHAGETLGLVGESGCGKSTLGRALVGLTRPTGGTIRFDGAELAALSRPARRQVRRQMQMVFQDPVGSLNPRFRIRDIVLEGRRIQQVVMTHLVSFISHGVFEKFPRLRLLLIEAGAAWLPSLLWRFDTEYKGLRREVPWLRRLPSEYVGQHVWLTTQPLEISPQREQVTELLGWINGGRVGSRRGPGFE